MNREPLHVGRPNIGDRETLLARIDDALDRRWLTNDGVYVAEFERRVADLIGVRHCVATSNGTAALQLLIRARGLHGGGHRALVHLRRDRSRARVGGRDAGLL